MEILATVFLSDFSIIIIINIPNITQTRLTAVTSVANLEIEKRPILLGDIPTIEREKEKERTNERTKPKLTNFVPTRGSFDKSLQHEAKWVGVPKKLP